MVACSSPAGGKPCASKETAKAGHNSTAKEGHNSTKNPPNIDHESVLNCGPQFTFYLKIFSLDDFPTTKNIYLREFTFNSFVATYITAVFYYTKKV